MKGIKECLKWMIDNEGKKIKCVDRLVFFSVNNFYTTSVGSDLAGVPNSLGFLMSGEWQEAIEPVDFITAYEDCKENGTEYKVEYKSFEDQFMRNKSGSVHIESEDDFCEVEIDVMWKKVR